MRLIVEHCLYWVDPEVHADKVKPDALEKENLFTHARFSGKIRKLRVLGILQSEHRSTISVFTEMAERCSDWGIFIGIGIQYEVASDFAEG